MLVIEFIIFVSVLTFLWFRTSIFSFRSVRLLRLSFWFWRSLVRPFLKLRSASNFKLLSLTTRTASYRVFLSNLFRYSKIFHDLWIFLSTIFKASSGQFLLFGLFLISQNVFRVAGKVFWNKMWMGSFFILNLIIKIKMTETQNDKKWESRQTKSIQWKSFHRYSVHSNDSLNLSHYTMSCTRNSKFHTIRVTRDEMKNIGYSDVGDFLMVTLLRCW